MDAPQLTPAQLQALSERDLRQLQGELPPITSDDKDPRNRYRRVIWAEGVRRGYWK